jgi:Protein of unknown function (DUF4239)
LLKTHLVNGFIVVAGISAAVAMLFMLRRQWTPKRLKDTNEISGFYIGIIGTIYAVIMAFMLSGVWLDYEDAEANTEKEANCLVSLYRLTRGLPDAQRNQLQDLAEQYAKTMIDEEWDAMSRNEASMRGIEITEAMWKEVTTMQAQTPEQHALVDHIMSELTSMTEHRRIRLLQSRQVIPGILWAVLIVGGVVTVGLSCFFGVDDLRLHITHTAALALLVTLMLVAVADLDRPFQGTVHVPPDGFKLALQTLNRLKAGG